MTRKDRHRLLRKSFQNIMLQIEFMRSELFLTDFMLKCEDKEFPVHKVILSAASSFFKGYFKTHSDENSLVIDFSNSATLKLALDFIYTGRLYVTEKSKLVLKDLIELSKTLEIPLMYNYCLKFLLNNVSPSQLLSQWENIEKMESKHIKQIYLEYLLKNMETLNQEDYLNLTYDKLNSLLQYSGEPSVNQEQFVKLILSWTENDRNTRENKVTDLLEKIDFDKLHFPFLYKLLNEPLLEKNVIFLSKTQKLLCHQFLGPQLNSNPIPCRNIVDKQSMSSAAADAKLCYQKDKKKTERIIKCSNDLSDTKAVKDLVAKRKSFQQKIICHGRRDLNGVVLCYNYKDKKWDEMANHIWTNELSNSVYSAMCAVNDQVYYFGGRNKCSEYFNDSYIFDTLKNRWFKSNGMHVNRGYAKAIELNGSIYVLGGWSAKDGKWIYHRTMERYNLRTRLWESVAEMPCDVGIYPAVTVVDGHLCLVDKSSLVWYNPHTNEWKYDNPLPVELEQLHSRVIIENDGKLFIIEFKPTNVYIFDLKMKTWNLQPVPLELTECTDIVKYSSEDCEFLVVSSVNCFLYKPPSTWKTFPQVNVIFPQLTVT